MGIQISFNTGELTTEDRDVIALAIGVSASAPAPATPAAKKAAPPAKKAAAKPAPEPAPEEAEDEDLLGDTAPTMQDAVAKATELVGEGRGADVKAALTSVGAGRVSELKPGQIADFLAALD